MIDAKWFLEELLKNETDNTIFNPRGVPLTKQLREAIRELENLKKKQCSRCGFKGEER